MAQAQFGVRRKNPPKEDRDVKAELRSTQAAANVNQTHPSIYLIGY
jgi:hypothetical protein